jgi:hypothetical protein
MYGTTIKNKKIKHKNKKKSLTYVRRITLNDKRSGQNKMFGSAARHYVRMFVPFFTLESFSISHSNFTSV